MSTNEANPYDCLQNENENRFVFVFVLWSILMVNQNENENKFIFVLGPYNENGLRFRSSGESYQNEFIFVFVLGYHKDRPDEACIGNGGR